MLMNVNLVDFINTLKSHIETVTKVSCYDESTNLTQPPYYYIKVAKTRPEHTKTMYQDTITIWIHVVAESDAGNVRLYELIHGLETAICTNLVLGMNYQIQTITNLGVLSLAQETDEHKAVIGFEFKISYGYKSKG